MVCKSYSFSLLLAVLVVFVSCKPKFNFDESDDDISNRISAMYYLDTITISQPYLVKKGGTMYIASGYERLESGHSQTDSTVQCLFPIFDEEVAGDLFSVYYNKVGDARSKSLSARIMNQASMSAQFSFEEYMEPDNKISEYETYRFKYQPPIFVAILVKGGYLFDVEYFDFTIGRICVPGDGYYIAVLPVFSLKQQNELRKQIGWLPLKFGFKFMKKWENFVF